MSPNSQPVPNLSQSAGNVVEFPVHKAISPEQAPELLTPTDVIPMTQDILNARSAAANAGRAGVVEIQRAA